MRGLASSLSSLDTPNHSDTPFLALPVAGVGYRYVAVPSVLGFAKCERVRSGHERHYC